MEGYHKLRTITIGGRIQVLLDKGKKPTPDYLHIPLLWTFANKYDGRKRATCITGGHMTPKIDTEDSTSTIVSLDTIKMVFLAVNRWDSSVLREISL